MRYANGPVSIRKSSRTGTAHGTCTMAKVKNTFAVASWMGNVDLRSGFRSGFAECTDNSG
jgi:hypothetical protein